jgi:hypothetical protein
MADLATTVSRWQQSAGTAQTRYTEGIQSTQKDVTGLAVAAQQKMLTNVVDSIQSGRWARGLQKGGTPFWKQQSIAKANNFSTGIAAGVPAYQSAMQVWLPIIEATAAQVQSMPNNSFADSIARMTANATALHNAKLSR